MSPCMINLATTFHKIKQLYGLSDIKIKAPPGWRGGAGGRKVTIAVRVLISESQQTNCPRAVEPCTLALRSYRMSTGSITASWQTWQIVSARPASACNPTDVSHRVGAGVAILKRPCPHMPFTVAAATVTQAY
jgi:hypothetical protein